MDGKIIPLDRGDKEKIAEVLALAFSYYPLMAYIYKVSQVPLLESLQAMFRVSCEIRLTFGWPMLGFLDSQGKMVGTALLNMTRGLDWPESLQQSQDHEFTQVVGTKAAQRLNDFATLADTGRPEEPHIGLGVIGVLPEAQGKGHGRRLLDHISALSENTPTSTGVWLDTETEHNVAYYQKFGYQVFAHSKLDNVVDIWGMFRPDKQ
ncbi:MAG TPA: GNAT family N-acetyltransferase [Anaerolineales bacterium]|nr:GNAT family N-acetyltransferase [Anaerolineales bacterium]